jgi:hypothetical protein
MVADRGVQGVQNHNVPCNSEPESKDLNKVVLDLSPSQQPPFLRSQCSAIHEDIWT